MENRFTGPGTTRRLSPGTFSCILPAMGCQPSKEKYVSEGSPHRASALAAESCLDRLKTLQAVQDVSERRHLTTEVHNILSQSWKADPRFHVAAHFVNDIPGRQLRKVFEHLLQQSSDTSGLPDLRDFENLMVFLVQHHTFEDKALFPLVRQSHPEFASRFKRVS